MNLEGYVQKFNELKTVFDSLPDGVVAIMDRELKIATANMAVSEMLHLPMEKIVGQSAAELFGGRIPGLDDVLSEAMNNREDIRNYTFEFVDSTGDVASYLVSTVFIDEISDTDIAMVLILHDISEVTRLRKIAMQINRYGEIIGSSEAMKRIYAVIESIKEYSSSVLIVGETGTGKELIARTIHNASTRKNEPFVPVNCSALPLGLIESELFGHVKGAFTGAVANRIGRFKAADKGTLFLDEVGTLAIETQVKLLRVLQEKVVEPLGAKDGIAVDFRVISATNRDLKTLIAEGKFREDLYYRLKIIQINLPPLRHRREDIPILIHYFITRLNRYYGKNILGMSENAEKLLMRYAWPGNVRELENSIEHAFVLSNGALIQSKDLPAEIRLAEDNGAPPLSPEADPEFEELRIKKALLTAKGNRDKAAQILGMHRTTLWRKMKEFRIIKGYGKPVN